MLQDQIEALLARVDNKDKPPDLASVAEELEDLAAAAEVTEVNCKRCDRPFRTIAGVEYCTKSCELGGWPQGHTRA
jgi:hypothetical protein